ncbi:hypothetical protein M0804_003469 [Polistes exclamans]|nr:hypothetical protein M0804_003469 [Polistes exclamans]
MGRGGEGGGQGEGKDDSPVVTLVDVGVNANANANANANGVAVVWHKPRSTFANGPADRHVLRASLWVVETVRFKVRRRGGGGGGGGGGGSWIRNEGDAMRPLPPFSCIVTHLHKQPRLHLYANRLVRLRKASLCARLCLRRWKGEGWAEEEWESPLSYLGRTLGTCPSST